jgi:hypothetical protein
MFWRKWFRTQRMGRINLKEVRIVLWDEVGPEAENMKPEMGYLAALSRKPPLDKAAKNNYNS